MDESDQNPEQATPENINTADPVEKMRHSTFRTSLSTVGILLLAPFLAIFLTLFVFQSYQVDGQSMETTLQNNDRLIVWKLPRTWARITGHQYVPNRGDVVILNEDGLNGEAGTKQLVKRVIGLPGDHVVIKNNIVEVYNTQNPNGFEPDSTLPYGQKDGAIPPTMGNVDVTLAKDELFVCGDNRPNSLDSRTFGPIKTSQVVGKLVIRILPLSNIKRF